MIDCDACIDAPRLEGLRRRATEGDASLRTSLIVAAGVDGEPTASVEMTFEGVVSDWLVAGLVAVCCAGATSSIVTL